MSRKEIMSFAASIELHKRPDAELLLIKHGTGMNFDVTVIKFATRKALEMFNERANLEAVIKTQVPMGCVLYNHQSDEEDRKVTIWGLKYAGGED